VRIADDFVHALAVASPSGRAMYGWLKLIAAGVPAHPWRNSPLSFQPIEQKLRDPPRLKIAAIGRL